MKALRLLGTLATVTSVGYFSVDQIAAIRAVNQAETADSSVSREGLSDTLHRLKQAQEEKKNRLLVLREVMDELQSQNAVGFSPDGSSSRRAPPSLGGAVDPSALERLRSWKNVSPEIKAEILRQYRLTGHLPSPGETTTGAEPAAVPSGAARPSGADIPGGARQPSSSNPRRIDLPGGDFVEAVD